MSALTATLFLGDAAIFVALVALWFVCGRIIKTLKSINRCLGEIDVSLVEMDACLAASEARRNGANPLDIRRQQEARL